LNKRKRTGRIEGYICWHDKTKEDTPINCPTDDVDLWTSKFNVLKPMI